LALVTAPQPPDLLSEAYYCQNFSLVRYGRSDLVALNCQEISPQSCAEVAGRTIRPGANASSAYIPLLGQLVLIREKNQAGKIKRAVTLVMV
jgi:hypothetical protein